MPRLLMVATVPDFLRAFLLPYARYFRARGWQVDAAARGATRDVDCGQAFDRVWDIPWSRHPLAAANFLRAPRRIQEIMARGSYDLVHVHTPVASFVTRWSLGHPQTPGAPKVIYTAHGLHFYRGAPALRNLIFRTLEEVAGRQTDYLVVLNAEDRQAALDSRLVAPGRLRHMPGIGVDTQVYSPDAISDARVAALRAELGLASGQAAFLMIAEFNPGKRHRDAIQALARLEGGDAVLLLAGTGRLVRPMSQLAERLGVSRRVRFLGYRRDIPALLRACIASVLPSEREGLPRSIIESLALAVPVIATDIRGVRDLVDSENGLLVPVGDADRLAHAMSWMLRNPDRARAMGEQGRRRIAAYDLRLVLSRHEDLYTEALAGRDCGQASAA